MVKITYTGPRSRVIAGKHLMHGETYEVNEKLVEALRGDPDIEFSDEEKRSAVSLQPSAEAEASEEAEVEEAPTEGSEQLSVFSEQDDVPTAVEKPRIIKEPNAARKPRSKKK
jgi:hypothetical protein